jgi:uncharacterized protein with HEPN domain
MRPEGRDPASLWDIHQSCIKISELLRGKAYESFADDTACRLAVERLLTIVGEAARRVSVDCRTRHPELPWRQMIGLRNVLMHEYDEVDLESLWNTAANDVPHLGEMIGRLIAAEGR